VEREGIPYVSGFFSFFLLLGFWDLVLGGLAAGYCVYMAHVWVRGLDDRYERGIFPRKITQIPEQNMCKKKKNTQGVYGTNE